MGDVVQLPLAAGTPPAGRIIFKFAGHLMLGGGARMTTWRNEELRIERVDMKGGAGAPWETVFRADAMPNREFKALRAMLDALDELRCAS